MIEPPGWDFTKISPEDVSVVLTSPTGLTATVAYGGEKHALVMTRLRAPVTALRHKLTKKRLVITLDKRDTALAWDTHWNELIATGALPPDAEEAD